ncbi:MAG: preprotein translocase subunit SecG [Bacteroidota bacterium]
MYGFLLSVELIVSILLTIIILMQSSKGGGLAGTFGGGNMGAVFGVRRTADFLSKMTTGLAVVFILLCLVINRFFLPTSSSKTTDSVIQRGAPQAVPPPQLPSQTQPNIPTPTPNQ